MAKPPRIPCGNAKSRLHMFDMLTAFILDLTNVKIYQCGTALPQIMPSNNRH
jgi:hypothetical protein